ncbi:hypothetical protein [Polymorphobacter fuscus]|uniref:hypothetical protein n=1 Tax=Sandarakinorhabdus fusca TaxID=1439888 RepID=UPI001694A5D9|nr:hypothetical protein [Polymorphobacter fuscus]NJC09276.1 siroheme synthase [Polymorphobacter fuscus]
MPLIKSEFGLPKVQIANLNSAAVAVTILVRLVIALAGQRVVRLKGGDPSIFGRSAEEPAQCLVHTRLDQRGSAIGKAPRSGPVLIIVGPAMRRGATVASGLPTQHKTILAELPDLDAAFTNIATPAMCAGAGL